MKTFSSLLALALLTSGFSASAQTTAPATGKPAIATPATTAPAPSDATATASGTTSTTDSSAEPKLSPAAMRARAMTSHGVRGKAPLPATSRVPGFKDGITVRDGKVVATQSGRSTYLSDSVQTMKMITGLEVSSTGVVTRPDGTTETLHEGDYISLTGRLETAEERKAHAQSLKENLKEDRKIAAKKARSPLRQLSSGF